MYLILFCIVLHQVVQLTLSVSRFTFRAGDYVMLNVPAISALDWHPFSVSSNPNKPDTFTVHVLSNGESTFTGMLASKVKQNKQRNVDFAVKLEGPYGQVALANWQTTYTRLVFVCGGIGATPIMSFLADLLHRRQTRQANHLQAVHLVWVVRSPEPIKLWFPDLLVQLAQAGVPFVLHLCSICL
jgi:ferredoxin-NADP reductase